MRWRALAFVLLGAPVMLGALVSCKLLAGYEEVEYAADSGGAGAADGGLDAEGGCLVTTTSNLFSTDNTLTQLFTSNGRLYIEIDDTNSDVGVLGCDPSSCAAPQMVVAPGPQVASSAPGPAGLYYSISSIQNGDDGGADFTGEIDVVGTGGKKLVASGLGFSYLLGVAEAGTFYTDDPQNQAAAASGESRLKRIADGGTADWFGGMFDTYQVALGSSRVFVLAEKGSTTISTSVFACSLQTPCGASPTVVATGVDNTAGSIAVDGDTLFFTQDGSRSVQKVGADGGATAIATDQTSPSDILVDGDYVYWIAITKSDPSTTDTVGDVRRTKKDGSGAIERVVCDLATPSLLAADTDHLYFSTTNATSTATVVRADKPR